MEISPVYNFDLAAFIHRNGKVTLDEIREAFRHLTDLQLQEDLRILTSAMPRPEAVLIDGYFVSRYYRD